MAFYINTEIAGKIAGDTRTAEMIFIGEMPHHNKTVTGYVHRLTVELSKISKYGILAMESFYCLYPFFERRSAAGEGDPFIGSVITDYNREVSKEKRIIVTSIDMAHSIKHSPAYVHRFIDFLSAGTQDEKVRELFRNHSEKILSLRTISEKENFIGELKKMIAEHGHSFDERTGEELDFYAGLLMHSLGNTEAANEAERKSRSDTRNMWFIETIRRALERTRHHGAKMICYVGAPHAYKAYLNDDDYYVGETPEAMYFNGTVFPDKVYSILIRPFFLDGDGERTEKIEDPVEKIAYEKTGDGDGIFIDLKELKKRNMQLPHARYWKDDVFQFDALIYVRENG